MHSIFHINSASELDADFIAAVKLTYKNAPIKIIIEEIEEDDITIEQRNELDRRLKRTNKEFIDIEESFFLLDQKRI